MLPSRYDYPPAPLGFRHAVKLYRRLQPLARDIRRHALLLLWLLSCVAWLNTVPVHAQGTITTVAGNGSRGFSGDGGPAVNALLDIKHFTGGVAADAAGNVYIADTGNHRVRKIDPGGTISTVAGNGIARFSGDGGPATSASLFAPTGLGVDGGGNLYVVDTGNQRIRKVSPNGTISTVAGNGIRSFSGDGGIATAASLSLGNIQYLGIAGYATSVALDGAGNLYIADTDNGRVRKVDPSGIITSVVAGLRDPYSVAADSAGNLFVTDSSNDKILKVSASGSVTVIAGGLSSPSGLALDHAGNLYIADSHTHRIRKVDPNGVTTIVAGSGDPIFDIDGYHFVGGYSGDGGPATSALMNFPWGVAVDAAGNVYIADSLNNRIRKVTAASTDGTHTFTSPDRILLLGPGPVVSIPYPSAITVSGLAGSVTKVTATITIPGAHGAPRPADLAFLLVGPDGQSLILMSGVSVNGITQSLMLTFDDAAPSSLTSNLASGTYKPSPFRLVTFPPPAPTDPYAKALSIFNGTNPNGEWKLYAVNFYSDLGCGILGEGCTEVAGWSLTVTTTASTLNPIDDAQFFVRQQYRDFLNREADQAGEDFWTDNITKCMDPARRPPGQTVEQCTLRQRETTSGAFFQSPEFQYTGYFVHRMYQGALGRQPKLSEFTPDAQFVGAGILVNSQLSGAKINQNKADFAAQFVNCTDASKSRCAEFKAIYDGLSNQAYVDKLFEKTGVNASAADRAALVNGLNAIPATETRASVLQKVVDGINVISEGNQQFTTTYGLAFYNAELNRAFVLLQYFGYMKRDPDEAGYAFWLAKLNQFNGNFVNAEMVLAFISSPEYRARFGQP